MGRPIRTRKGIQIRGVSVAVTAMPAGDSISCAETGFARCPGRGGRFKARKTAYTSPVFSRYAVFGYPSYYRSPYGWVP